MRVTSDRQTLILAGESPPRRAGRNIDRIEREIAGDNSDSAESQQVTFIGARVDAVITQGLYSLSQLTNASQQAGEVEAAPIDVDSYVVAAVSGSATALPTLPSKLHQSYIVSNRGTSTYAANAYARTRDLADRTPLVDIYA